VVVVLVEVVEVVVLVEVVVDVVVVGGGAVVVVVDGGGAVVVVVVVVVVAEAPGPPGTDAAGVGNDQSAAAQSGGWVATAMSTPGMVLNDQTSRGGPFWRQARAGSVVPMGSSVPRYWAVPPGVGVAIGVKETEVPCQVETVVKPVPGGPVDGPVVGPLW
jgi:hypothetical protein